MDRYARFLCLLIILSVCLGGCFNLKQPSRKMDYYMLEYESPKTEGRKPVSVVVRVERFSVAPTCNTNRIVYRDTSFKRNTYSYHQWRANPGDLVTHFLNRDLMGSGLFRAVLSHDSRSPSSHVLEGSVDEFFEWDRNDRWMAVLSLSITLMVDKEPDVSKRILFQKTYSTKQACSRKNPQSLAEAMSRAMAELSREIMEDIYGHVGGKEK